MREIEKAAAGLLYNANTDPEIWEMRRAAKLKLHAINALCPSNQPARSALFRGLFGSIGDNFVIEWSFYCDYGFNIHIGNNFYANANLVILDPAPVTIGDNVLIAPNVGIYTATHPLDKQQRRQGLEYALPINIGNNVWIGGGVSILPGVAIGDDAVIGSGSVVTRSVPSGVVALGNPCRVLRNL